MYSLLQNAHSTTGTALRLDDPSYLSGMCPICIRECAHLCEVGKSAFRGREVLYPLAEYFGRSTQASNKDYYLDFTHFQILPGVRGAKGMEPDPDKALFPNVDITTVAGGVPLKLPIIIAALGSTQVAKANWAGLAVGAALSGTIVTVGENVCGMDPDAEFDASGKVLHSPDLQQRVETFRRHWDGKYGDIVVQTNVEDQRAGVELYAIKKLGVNIIERKWGQGAKAIGGEVRVFDLETALKLKHRGYVVLPDPEDEAVQEAFRRGVFHSFERHSRVGMPELNSFVEDIAWLREQGAKRVFLKVGAYKPDDIAFILRCASQAGIDLVTFDGGGGGTGMSPVPMMQECSVPTVYLLALVFRGIDVLRRNGKYIPDIAIAGGFACETQMFKAIAMSNLGFGQGPQVKAISTARAPLAAAMKADYFVELAAQGKLPAKFAREYGTSPEQFFIATMELRHRNGDGLGGTIPWSAVGVYTYFTDRLGVGLKQLMAGCRKFNLHLLDRSDLAALTRHAAEVTSINPIWQVNGEVFQNLLTY